MNIKDLETRPENCRFRLQDEGKAYPRSSCQHCGKSIMTGLGKKCTEYEQFKETEGVSPEQVLRTTKNLRNQYQLECDRYLEKAIILRNKIKEMNMQVNKLKRIIRENSTES